MKADELQTAIGRIAASLPGAGTAAQRVRRLAQHLFELPPADQVDLILTIGGQAADDPACGQILLLVVDPDGFRTALGADAFERLRQALAGHPRGAATARRLQSLSGVAPDRVPLLRAKTGLALQALALVNDRLERERQSVLRLDGFEIAARVLDDSGLEDTRVRVAVPGLGGAALAAARDALLEAEFDELEGGGVFETAVTDEQLRVLGEASGLGRARGAGPASALPEAVAQREALLLVRRFCLLCRSATMYPPGHPSLPPAFAAFSAVVERAIEDREQMTLTVLGGDVLLDDVKIRRDDRFKKSFIDLFDERQVSSLTFRRGFTVEQVTHLVHCFTQSPKLVKDAGGVRALLARRSVSHIVVDQFRYRVVADDGTLPVEPHPGPSGDRLLESLIYSHVLDRLERGASIASLTVEELGAFFKDLLTSPDEDKRRALARLLIALDPGLLERGFLANPELRRSVSWSAARKLLDVALGDLARDDAEAREQALETIAQLADVAVARQKDATVGAVARRLAQYVATEEPDPDLRRRAAQAYALLVSTYVRRRRLDRAAELVNLLGPPVEAAGALAADDAPALQAVREALAAADQGAEMIDLLVEAVAGQDPGQGQAAGSILEALPAGMAVSRLFRLFLDPDRAVRLRAYRLLKRIGPRALGHLRREIEERQLPSHPGRDPATGRVQADADWYILRNCMDLLAELDPARTERVLADLSSDADPRVRRESVRLLVRGARPESASALRQALDDPSPEVREAAMAGVGALRDELAVEPLIDAVYRFPGERRAALEALAHIGSIRCADFLLAAFDTLESGRRRRRRRPGTRLAHFPADREAILEAIAGLALIGGPDVENRLVQFSVRWSAPYRRWSWQGRGLRPRTFLAPVENALALVERRAARAAPPAGPDARPLAATAHDAPLGPSLAGAQPPGRRRTGGLLTGGPLAATIPEPMADPLLRVEPATAEDVPGVVALIGRVFAEYGFVYDPATEVPDLLAFGEHYANPGGAFWVVRASHGVVGSVGVERLDAGTAELHRLYLDPHLRGRGLGRDLVEAVLAWCRDEGIPHLVLWSDIRFDRAHRLYERLGFVQVGERELPGDPNQTREYRYERPVGGETELAP